MSSNASASLTYGGGTAPNVSSSADLCAPSAPRGLNGQGRSMPYSAAESMVRLLIRHGKTSSLARSEHWVRGKGGHKAHVFRPFIDRQQSTRPQRNKRRHDVHVTVSNVDRKSVTLPRQTSNNTRTYVLPYRQGCCPFRGATATVSRYQPRENNLPSQCSTTFVTPFCRDALVLKTLGRCSLPKSEASQE